MLPKMDPPATEQHHDDAPETPTKLTSHSASNAPESPKVSGQHDHKDSMVTIRLSDLHQSDPHENTPGNITEKLPQIEIETPPADVTEKLHIDTTNVHNSINMMDPSAEHEAAVDRQKDELVGTGRVEPSESGSKVRFADENTARAPSTISSLGDAETMMSTDDQAVPSTRSSNSSLPSSVPEEAGTLGSELERCAARPRSDSMASSLAESAHVDWEVLDKNEEQEQEQQGDATDENTAFLLARLEQENNALAIDPKAGLVHSRTRSASRPPSFQQLKKLVLEQPSQSSLRYSMLPTPPPMTELEFWSALVSNYLQTAQRLPTLTSSKIRSGIPPPLRGVVWMSIAGARDNFLEDEYDRLSVESSPYEKIIHKDLGRSFPGVDMFREPGGDGQRMLGKVLNAFSLWDREIGYCQGLGFVVGPLLMHMGDKEAFCVLVRLMEHYDLRSCFLPDLSGLHLRIYQFQHLVSQHLPELTAHLDALKLEPLYLSQWFLSFFAVTCPLPMLIRIYDVILTEGASETLMRVALSLMRRNSTKILALNEFGDVMQLLLSRALWDTYNCNADDLVNDFCSLTGLVTRESLQALEANFKENQQSSPTTSKPSAHSAVHSAASRFLGRFWTASSTSPRLISAPTISLAAPGRPGSNIRRTASKQSVASTLNSVESIDSNQSAASTDATSISRHTSADWIPVKQTVTSGGTVMTMRVGQSKDKDRDLHDQIEELLKVLGDVQRENSLLASELQREKEERDEDRTVVQKLVEQIRKRNGLAAIPEDCTHEESDTEIPIPPELEPAISELEKRFAVSTKRSSLSLQTKQQLREEASRWKDQYNEQVARSSKLSRQLSDSETEISTSKEQLREARARIVDAHRDKQRLEKANRELKSRRTPVDLSLDTSAPSTESQPSPNGLREFKLGRRSSVLSTPQITPTFNKRTSSLLTREVLATDDHKPAAEEALLLELVNAKTAEAVARQELEEVKGKLDAMRKLLSGPATSPPTNPGNTAVAATNAAHRKTPPSPALNFSGLKGPADKVPTPSSAAGGYFFSGWGKRTLSGAQ